MAGLSCCTPYQAISQLHQGVVHPVACLQSGLHAARNLIHNHARDCIRTADTHMLVLHVVGSPMHTRLYFQLQYHRQSCRNAVIVYTVTVTFMDRCKVSCAVLTHHSSGKQSQQLRAEGKHNTSCRKWLSKQYMNTSIVTDCESKETLSL